MGQPPHTTEILVIDDPDELDRLRTATVEDYRQMISAMKNPLTRLLTKWQIGAELFHVIEGHGLPLAEIANEAFVKDGTDHYLYHAPALMLFHDRTTAGKPLKWLAVTDEYTRECLALEVDRSITADKVVDVLINLFLTRGVPKHIRSDNGPEFIAQAISKHAERTGLEMLYIEPGSPWENRFAESFFSRLRDELLNCEEFENLAEARWFARRRQKEHNEERPHSSLNYQTPAAFAALCAASAPELASAMPQPTPSLQQHREITQPVLS